MAKFFSSVTPADATVLQAFQVSEAVSRRVRHGVCSPADDGVSWHRSLASVLLLRHHWNGSICVSNANEAHRLLQRFHRGKQLQKQHWVRS